VVWKDIHGICSSRAGLQPVQPRAVRKQDGSLCCGSEETWSKWRGHFEGVLIIENSFNVTSIDVIKQMTMREKCVVLLLVMKY